MRGGTSKGVFLTPDALPDFARKNSALRDKLFLRLIGSPDPYGQQIDGMGGGSSSTSKVVLVSKSTRQDCDVDYLFGAVAIGQAVIDWSGNCGNLTAAVGPFAIAQKLIQAPENGLATVRIWQANLGKKIIAHVPIKNGQVQEQGEFWLDGVAFPSAEIKLEFLEVGGGEDENSPLFPTGNLIDSLQVMNVGAIQATLINAGNPTIFVNAASLGLSGTESQSQLNSDPEKLAMLEAVRAHAAVLMGLAVSAQDATLNRPSTPKLAWLAAPKAYVSASGREVNEMDMLARIMSMGKLHHAMTGTGAVALAVAAAIPGTIAHQILKQENNQTSGDINQQTPKQKNQQQSLMATSLQTICFGHPSGLLKVGAEVAGAGSEWQVKKVVLSRSARVLMEGWLNVPECA